MFFYCFFGFEMPPTILHSNPIFSLFNEENIQNLNIADLQDTIQLELGRPLNEKESLVLTDMLDQKIHWKSIVDFILGND